MAREWVDIQPFPNINTTADEFAPYYYSQDISSSSGMILYSRGNTARKLFTSYGSDSTRELLTEQFRKFSLLESAYLSLDESGQLYTTTENNGERQYYPNIGISRFAKNVYQKTTIIDSLKCNCFTSQPTVNRSGTMMAFTSNRYNEDINDTDIWIAKKLNGNKWGKAYNFELINTNFTEMTPMFSGDTLFFASNGFGGKGGLDLYFTYLKNGEWTRPISLNINSEANESDPFLLPDGNLLFTSDRAGGAGGTDIYIAKKDNSERIEYNPISVDIKGFLPQITLKNISHYTTIPLLDTLRYNSIDSETYNFDSYTIKGRNLLVASLARSLERSEDIFPLTVNITIPNLIEKDVEKNAKYYADKRLVNLFGMIENEYIKIAGELFNYSINDVFKINYIPSDNFENQLYSTIVDNKKSNLIYTFDENEIKAYPTKMPFTLITSRELNGEENWQLAYSISDNSQPDSYTSGKAIPDSPVELAIIDPNSIYKIRKDELEISLNIFKNKDIISSDNYQLPIIRTRSESYKMTSNGNTNLFEIFSLKSCTPDNVFDMLVNYIGNQVISSNNINIEYKGENNSDALLFADRLETYLQSKGMTATKVIASRYEGFADTDSFNISNDYPSWLYKMYVTIPAVKSVEQ